MVLVLFHLSNHLSRWLGFLDVFTGTSDRFIANHNTQSNPFITCLYELTLWNSVAKNTWISATSYCEYYKRHYFIKGTSFFPALTPKPIYYIQHFWGCWLVYILSWKCPPSLPCSTLVMLLNFTSLLTLFQLSHIAFPQLLVLLPSLLTRQKHSNTFSCLSWYLSFHLHWAANTLKLSCSFWISYYIYSFHF